MDILKRMIWQVARFIPINHWLYKCCMMLIFMSVLTARADLPDPIIYSPQSGTKFNSDYIQVAGSVPPGYRVEFEVDWYSALFLDNAGNQIPANEYQIPVNEFGQWEYRMIPLGEYEITTWLYTVSEDGMEESYGLPFSVHYDIQPPIISLNGNKVSTVLMGENYSEQGATTDDGTAITIDSSDVDMTTVGTYEVFYSATDEVGNTMTTSRIINVVDPVAPREETSCYGYGNTKSTLCKNGLAVRVDHAWTVGATGEGGMIAVVDHPIDAEHPFFAGKKVLKNSSQTCTVNDNTCSHGTNAAGVAAGRGADINGDGVVDFSGIAKDADIFGFSGMGSLTLILERIYDTHRHNDNIVAVTMSFGSLISDATYYDADGTCDRYPSSARLKSAVENLKSVGIGVFAASGNDGMSNRIIFPACVSNITTVAAIDVGGSITSYSNLASGLDIAVPTNSYTSNPHYYDRVYQGMSGTSAAAPLAAGAFAVLKQQYPSATVDEILEAMIQSGNPIYSPHSNHRGYYSPTYKQYMPRLPIHTLNLVNAMTTLDASQISYCGKSEAEFDSVVKGTDEDDVLTGTDGNDLILGYAGDDEINGLNGDDCIYAGDGHDEVFGGSGADTIYGGEGDDVLWGKKGNDTIFGEAGRDVLRGRGGDDFLSGGAGDDLITAGAGNDILEGNEGDDVLEGRIGQDILYGNEGADVMNGAGSGNDQNNNDVCYVDEFDSVPVYCTVI